MSELARLGGSTRLCGAAYRGPEGGPVYPGRLGVQGCRVPGGYTGRAYTPVLHLLAERLRTIGDYMGFLSRKGRLEGGLFLVIPGYSGLER